MFIVIILLYVYCYYLTVCLLLLSYSMFIVIILLYVYCYYHHPYYHHYHYHNFVFCHRHFLLYFPPWTNRDPTAQVAKFGLQFFLILGDIISVTVFFNESTQHYLDMVSNFFKKPCVTIPVAPVTVDTVTHFIFRIHFISVYMAVVVWQWWQEANWYAVHMVRILLHLYYDLCLR